MTRTVELLKPAQVELLINPALAAMEAAKQQHGFSNLQVIMALEYFLGVALHQAGVKLDPEQPMHRTLAPMMQGYQHAPDWSPMFGTAALSLRKP